MKQNLALLATVILAVGACSDGTGPTRPTLNPEAKMVATVPGEPVIPGRFIVTLRDDISPAMVAAEHGISPDFVYRFALRGFAGGISELARSGLLRDRRVIRIEPDGIAYAIGTQTGATWGLDRTDQRSRTLDGSYTWNNAGAGVTAYIIDTGIEPTHSEFEDRASIGYDAIGDGKNGIDCNGHGTHVAGTVGGKIYGIAKAVKLVGVRVLNCSGSGSWSGVIAGMDYVASVHQSGAPAVANLSLGGGASVSVDDAVRRMINDGVATAVAAGNGNWIGIAQDACRSSPARVAEAMTISATDKADKKASWANYGNCVDWFAPGVGISSAWLNGGTNTISGTSMATPHTAGVAALYLSVPGNSGATPADVRTALYNNTTKMIVTSSKSANNHLLFANY